MLRKSSVVSGRLEYPACTSEGGGFPHRLCCAAVGLSCQFPKTAVEPGPFLGAHSLVARPIFIRSDQATSRVPLRSRGLSLEFEGHASTTHPQYHLLLCLFIFMRSILLKSSFTAGTTSSGIINRISMCMLPAFNPSSTSIYSFHHGIIVNLRRLSVPRLPVLP